MVDSIIHIPKVWRWAETRWEMSGNSRMQEPELGDGWLTVQRGQAPRISPVLTAPVLTCVAHGGIDWIADADRGRRIVAIGWFATARKHEQQR